MFCLSAFADIGEKVEICKEYEEGHSICNYDLKILGDNIYDKSCQTDLWYDGRVVAVKVQWLQGVKEDTDKLHHLKTCQVPAHYWAGIRSQQQHCVTSSTRDTSVPEVHRQTGGNKDTSQSAHQH